VNFEQYLTIHLFPTIANFNIYKSQGRLVKRRDWNVVWSLMIISLQIYILLLGEFLKFCCWLMHAVYRTCLFTLGDNDANERFVIYLLTNKITEQPLTMLCTQLSNS